MLLVPTATTGVFQPTTIVATVINSSSRRPPLPSQSFNLELVLIKLIPRRNPPPYSVGAMAVQSLNRAQILSPANHKTQIRFKIIKRGNSGNPPYSNQVFSLKKLLLIAQIILIPAISSPCTEIMTPRGGARPRGNRALTKCEPT